MAAQTKEKNLEEDIESFLCSPEGGFFKCDDRHSLLYVEDGTYQMVGGGYMEHRDRALDAATLVKLHPDDAAQGVGSLRAHVQLRFHGEVRQGLQRRRRPPRYGRGAQTRLQAPRNSFQGRILQAGERA